MDDAGLGLRSTLLDMGRKARAGAATLRLSSAESRSAALTAMAASLRAHVPTILSANGQDLEAARAAGLSAALLDRLALTPERIEAIAAAVDSVAALPDPVSVETERWTRPNGLDIARVAVPIGVIAMIYEARPNVTAGRGGPVRTIRQRGDPARRVGVPELLPRHPRGAG